jgi:fluoride exporter
VVIAALIDRHHLPAWLPLGVAVGILGGYTTFSTFAEETLDLVEEGRVPLALLYTVSSVGLGVLAVFAGMKAGRLL